MRRRDFMKGAALAAAFVSSWATPAKAYGGEKGSKDLLRLRNREEPSVMEQKHVPFIEAPSTAKKEEWFDVTVRVGFMKEHPSAPSHWITLIKLLINGREVAITENKVGGVTWPHATFKIRLQETAKIEAIENCNLHGTWIGDPVTIEVV
jgi:superoxide reductase